MIVTRFAPSPTGSLHLGGARTALFNYLYARKHGGQFILRIEDTDRNRLVKESIEQYIFSLEWLGIDWDFGPDKPSPDFGSCIQSLRLDIYQKIAKQLVESGQAYYDRTSPEKLDRMRQQAVADKRPFIFRKSMAEIVDKPDEQTAVRIAFKDDKTISWDDIIKGKQSWQTDQIEDFVILKSDGYPTYHFACVIDDYLMKVNPVIRGDEWLSSTPKHLHLFDCLNYKKPEYAHVPPILNPTGNKKLSKREQDANIDYFKKAGYLPAGLINFMILIGWSPKNEQEFFDMDQLLKSFSLDGIQASPGRFNQPRLDYLNGKHIRSLSKEDRFELCKRWWPESSKKFDVAYKKKVLKLVYERLKMWGQLPELTDYFFKDPKTPTIEDLAEVSKLTIDQIQTLCPLIGKTLKTSNDLDLELLEKQWRQLAEDHDIKTGKLFMLIRFQLTGSKTTPGLFDIIKLLGRNISIQRLEAPSSNG